MTGRLVIEDIRPRTPGCQGFAKAIVGETVRVTAVMFKDGHEPISGRVLLFPEGDTEPEDQAPLEPLGNDAWTAVVVPRRLGRHHIVVEGWTQARPEEDLTRSDPSNLWVDRERALVGAWYELFPRSFGGFKGVATRVPEVAAMGFDVLYLPPIHPIGSTARKGPNNTLAAGPTIRAAPGP